MDFLGYLIVNEQEEFLHDAFFSGHSYSIAWSSNPFISKFFPDRFTAEDVKRKINRPGLFVLDAYQKGDSLVVASKIKKKPKWLN